MVSTIPVLIGSITVFNVFAITKIISGINSVLKLKDEPDESSLVIVLIASREINGNKETMISMNKNINDKIFELKKITLILFKDIFRFLKNFIFFFIASPHTILKFGCVLKNISKLTIANIILVI
jgi:hypothetical protein